MPDETFKQFVVDQLSPMSGVTSRKMFGGYGLSRNGRFFGIIYKGRVYLKVSSRTVSSYRKRGMKAFRPNAKQTFKTYYEVPVDIIENADELTAWAEQALLDYPRSLSK